MYVTSLVPRPSITANAVEGLVKLLHRMTSGGGLEAWLTCHACTSTGVYRKCHTSRRPPDVILRRPSTVLAVIEDLGTRLVCHTFCHNYQASSSSLRYTCIIQLLTKSGDNNDLLTLRNSPLQNWGKSGWMSSDKPHGDVTGIVGCSLVTKSLNLNS